MLREILDQLKALSDESRLKIFKLVKHQEMCVCQIVPAVGLSQPTVSVHLGKLKRAGLVRERRTAQWTYYSVDPAGLARFKGNLGVFLEAELGQIEEMRELASRLPPCPSSLCPSAEATVDAPVGAVDEEGVKKGER